MAAGGKGLGALVSPPGLLGLLQFTLVSPDVGPRRRCPRPLRGLPKVVIIIGRCYRRENRLWSVMMTSVNPQGSGASLSVNSSSGNTIWLGYKILPLIVTATPVPERPGARAAGGKWPSLGSAWGHVGSSCGREEEEQRKRTYSRCYSGRHILIVTS